MSKIEAQKISTGDSTLPGPSYVELCLTEYSSDDKTIFLSSHLMTDKEIDEAVDQLIEQLEKARIAAKKLLPAHK